MNFQTSLHCTTLNHNALHQTPPHCTVPHSTTLHCTKLHYIALHLTPPHCTMHHTPPNLTSLHHFSPQSVCCQPGVWSVVRKQDYSQESGIKKWPDGSRDWSQGPRWLWGQHLSDISAVGRNILPLQHRHCLTSPPNSFILFLIAFQCRTVI